MLKRMLALSLVIGGLFWGVESISAYQGDPTVQGPNCDPERHQAIEQAINNQDYQSWRELMADRGRVTKIVTAQNFNKFAEAHRLALNGQTEAARQIRTELGLGVGQSANHQVSARQFGRGK